MLKGQGLTMEHIGELVFTAVLTTNFAQYIYWELKKERSKQKWMMCMLFAVLSVPLLTIPKILVVWEDVIPAAQLPAWEPQAPKGGIALAGMASVFASLFVLLRSSSCPEDSKAAPLLLDTGSYTAKKGEAVHIQVVDDTLLGA